MDVSIKKHFIFYSLYQLISILIPLILTPFLTRTLGAEGLGGYSYAYSVASYFTLFIKLGLVNYGTRTVAEVRDDYDKRSKLFWNIYIIQFTMMIIWITVYIIYCCCSSVEGALAWIMIPFVLSSGMDATWGLWGLDEFEIATTRDFLVKLGSTGAVFMIVRTAEDVWKYTLIMSISALISQIVLWPVILKKNIWCRPSIHGFTTHIKPCLVLFLPTIAVSLYRTMDKIILGALSGNKELGFYHSCENIILIPLALVTALGTVMMPKMSNLYANNAPGEETFSIINISMHFTALLSSVMLFGIMTVSKEFVPLFYGKGFEKCIYLFWIILPSCIFMAFANVIRTQFLIPKHWDRVYIVSLFAGAIANLGLDFKLIPEYGCYGAAFGTLIAEILVCLIQSYAVRNELYIEKQFFEILIYILAGLFMFLLIEHVRLTEVSPLTWLLLKIVLAAVSFIVILVIMLCVVKMVGRIIGKDIFGSYRRFFMYLIREREAAR